MHLQLKKTPHLFIEKRVILTLAFTGAFFFLIGIADSVFFNEVLKNEIGKKVDPRWYIAFLGFPHIFASLLSFTVKDHVRSYDKSKWKKLILTLAGIAFVFFINNIFFSILFLFFISTHIVGQSLGIIRSWSNITKEQIWLWKILNSLLISAGLLNVYSIDLKWLMGSSYQILLTLSYAIIPLCFALTFIFCTQTDNFKSKLLIVCTQMQILGMFYFPINGNLLFGLILLVLNHDLVAFYYYLVHRYNNTNLQSCFFMLLVSIGVSVLLVHFLSFSNAPKVIVIFQMIHYLVEKQIWQSNSIHRRLVSINP